MKKLQNILNRLAELEKKTEKASYTVEYENGTQEKLQWGEFMCYSVMHRSEPYKDELLTITKLYCKKSDRQYLDIPFALIRSTNGIEPEVIEIG